MNATRRIFAAALGLLTGCASATAPVSANDVYAIESGYQAAATLAHHYTSLPACPTATPVCADPNVKASIKVKDNDAWKALMTLKTAAAANAPAALAAMQVALAALESAVPAVPAAAR
jgi:hypothetical protein